MTCTEYIPTSTNFHEIDSIPPQIDIQFSGQGDTLLLTPVQDLNFALHAQGRQIYGIWFYIENELLYFSDEYRYQPISFKPFFKENGVYQLDAIFDASPGTSSLADALEYEHQIVNHSFEIYYDNGSYPENISIQSVTPTDSGLVLIWSSFANRTFDYVSINRSFHSGCGTMGGDQLYLDMNASPDSWLDRYYVGGRVDYFLMVSTRQFGERFGPTVTFQDDFASFLKVDVDSMSNQISVTWSACKYPGNFARYEVHWRAEGYVNSEIVQNFNTDDTSAVIQATSVLAGDLSLLTYSNADDYGFSRTCDYRRW